MRADTPLITCQVRVTRGEDIAIGPGKMALLAAIRDSGSISGAARQMKMSYRRAWLLVETMNSCFVHPLVVTSTGGRAGGGAHLTPHGEQVLAGYAGLMEHIDAIAADYLRHLVLSTPLTDSPAPTDETA